MCQALSKALVNIPWTKADFETKNKKNPTLQVAYFFLMGKTNSKQVKTIKCIICPKVISTIEKNI